MAFSPDIDQSITSWCNVGVEPSPIDEPRASSQGEITLPVTDTDARTAVWLGHGLTKKLAAGALTVIVTLAGLWGNALLEETRGLRTDLQALAVSSAGQDGRLRALEAGLSEVKAKLEGIAWSRYGAALNNYEERHGPAPATSTDTTP